MNVIDAISRDHFLKELFPDGLTEEVLFGHLGFDLGDRFSLNIHTKQRPAKEISKWGQWGSEYDVVVICLLGRRATNIKISNWEHASFAKLECFSTGETFTIDLHKDDWELGFSFRSLVFQECRTYMW